MSSPQVDISPFLHSGSPVEARQSAAEQLHRACVGHGFFYLTGHGVPAIVQENVLAEARRWFLTTSQEDKDLVKGQGPRGYQQLGENITQSVRDKHEAIDFLRPWSKEDFPALGADEDLAKYAVLQGENKWPSEGFKAIFEDYFRTMSTLGSALMRCMARSLGLSEDHFVSATDTPFWGARIIGYPTALNGEVSCGPHSDYGCFTLLLTDSSTGSLQIRMDDGSWRGIDPVPGAYIVNIGDMSQIWTNGLFKSTVHKVDHSADEYRVSIPYFFEPNLDARISPLSICLQKTGGVARFKDLTYGDHLLQKVAQNYVQP